MSTNQGIKKRDIFGQNLWIKGKKVIDENTNLNCKNAKVNTLKVRKDLTVNGTATFHKNATVCGDIYVKL